MPIDDLNWYTLQVLGRTAVTPLTDDRRYINEIQALQTKLRGVVFKRAPSLDTADPIRLASAAMMLLGIDGIDAPAAAVLPVSKVIELLRNPPAAGPASPAPAVAPAVPAKRQGRLPKAEHDALHAAVKATLGKHATLKDDLPLLMKATGATAPTARRIISELEDEYRKSKPANPVRSEEE